MRVTVGPAAPTTIIYASLDQPNDKLIALLFAAEALRRGRREAARPARALSLLHAAGHGLSPGRSDQPEGHRPAARTDASIASSPSMLICIARPTSERRVSRHRGRQSLGHAGHRRRRCAQTDLIPRPSSSGRMPNRGPGSAISPAGSVCPMPLRRKTRRGDRSVEIAFHEPDMHCRSSRPDRRRYRFVRRHHDRLRQGAGRSRRDRDRRRSSRTHCFREAARTRWFIGRHPLDPFDPQRAASHQCHRARRSVRRRLAGAN